MSGLKRYAPILLLVLIWEMAPRLGLIDPSSVPPLSKVAVAWWSLLRSGDLASNGLSSLENLSAGLALGVVVGAALGVLMAWYRPLDHLVHPLVRAL